jgi:Tryptophan synthase alpha chain
VTEQTAAGTGAARVAGAFAAAREEGRAALMPYMMGGFPDRDTSGAIAEAYVEAGADLIELGVPFSDPLADGPVIHAADTAALAAGATLESVLETCATIGARVPVALMCYANMVLATEVEEFVRRAEDAGAAAVIVPDLPLEEQGGIAEALSDLLRGRWFRLPRLDRRRHRRAGGAPCRAHRAGPRGQGRGGGARRGRLRDLDPRAGGERRHSRRRGDRRDAAGAGGLGRRRSRGRRGGRERVHLRGSRRSRAIASAPMQLLLFTVAGASVMVIAYAFNVSGPVCALLFLGGVFTGGLLRVAQPIIDWITRP